MIADRRHKALREEQEGRLRVEKIEGAALGQGSIHNSANVLSNKVISPNCSTDNDSAPGQRRDAKREVNGSSSAGCEEETRLGRVENHPSVLEQRPLGSNVKATQIRWIASVSFQIIRGSLETDVGAGSLDLEIGWLNGQAEGKAAELVTHPRAL
jgi:hypothetical protein